jgi:hypothetical protein
MSTAIIQAGVCGFTTTVIAEPDVDSVKLTITSECEAIRKLAEHLPEVNPYKEISFRRVIPLTYQEAMKYCTHAACPIPAGIIKAVEVASGLALPADVSIQIHSSCVKTTSVSLGPARRPIRI